MITYKDFKKMISLMIDNIQQNPVAWYGAVIATISIVINFLNYLKDRAVIKIRFQKDMQILSRSPTPYDSNKTYFVVSVINKGKRPIKIVKAGAKVFRGDKKIMIFSDCFAISGERILTETNPSTDFVVEQELINIDNLEYLWVEDGTGKIYRKYVHSLPKTIFRKLKLIIKD